ncbi:fumarylacetoacetate hydrolase family protein [Olivibacter domesticus]|uniref:Fumarylacetoacetate (FAA) hydrolase n=1 Tax=Olivibacter domesticus TaxID=407022 RepID=A0A1H7L5U8_OLID1|nr:fumarylacetoacetate hydrolase family protein [Olivibacter domesticus]SEK94372.1 fumarylacetoacetate (FAA) hydrolase [Olivibacter domesticus]
MKLVSYQINFEERIGLYVNNTVYDLNSCDKHIPSKMGDFLAGEKKAMERAHMIFERLIEDPDFAERIKQPIRLLSPIPHPPSLRDAYAFRQHVQTARMNRGLNMIPTFDEFPVFYFSNHRAVYGEGPIHCLPDHFNQLDFELEVAIVINKRGRNIQAHVADDYIGGYMIMNDFSARGLQMQEMKLNLGPAKGKDFATALGPWLVTTDELAGHACPSPNGHVGNTFNLEMKAAVNGIEVSKGNLADMHWTFAEIIERISYGVELFPGDIIGSGTVGTGCFLELNGTGVRENSAYQEQWLNPGDEISLSVSGLGVLTNHIVKEDYIPGIFTMNPT